MPLEAPKYQVNLKMFGNVVIAYRNYSDRIGRRIDNGKNLSEDRKKAYQGEVTEKSQKRVKQLLYAWKYALDEGNRYNKEMGIKNEIRLVFLTLTLSSQQVHEDKEIKKLVLEPYLKWLQREYDVKNWLWKAEKQRNGNIHFHLIIDRYVDKLKVQEKWNYYQNKLGYIDRYYEKTGKVNPPSTQVESFSSSEKGIDYAIKYATKENGNIKVQGLQMRVSNSLSKLKIMPVTIEVSKENDTDNYLSYFSERVIQEDYFIVYYLKIPVHCLYKFYNGFKGLKRYYLLMYLSLYVYDVTPQCLNLINLRFTDAVRYRMYKNKLLEFNMIDKKTMNFFSKFNII